MCGVCVYICVLFFGGWVCAYLNTSLGVVGALGEEGVGQDGVGADKSLADGGDGDHGGLLQHGGHCVMCGMDGWGGRMG